MTRIFLMLHRPLPEVSSQRLSLQMLRIQPCQRLLVSKSSAHHPNNSYASPQSADLQLLLSLRFYKRCPHRDP